jgi:glycosyltransferase involved in cell wall biosynthesis
MWTAEYHYQPRPAEEVTTVIYVGRLVPEKKPRLLMEAFARAAREGTLPTDATLLFVGEGPERPALESLVMAAGLDPRVKFAGHVVEIARLREFYATALCSVSPGYVGLSATQSFGFGVPMLVADGEPHSPEIEACQEGVNTRFFAANDSGSLAKGLVDIFAEKPLWLQRREAICQQTREHYSLDRMADTFSVVIASFLPGTDKHMPHAGAKGATPNYH